MLVPKSSLSIREFEHKVGIGRTQLRRVASCAAGYYRPFDREKKPGSARWRHIDNPQEPLKGIQRRLARKFLAPIALPDELYGGLLGRTILGNALPHVGKPTIVRFDVEDFFPSIGPDRVFGALRRHLACSTEIASLVTKLTTFQRRLPQGSPASTFLANLILVDVIQDLRAIAVARRLVLTVFVDDITFSGEGAETAIGEVMAVLSKHKLRISRPKLDIAHEHRSRVVTGVSVSRLPSIPRLRLRAIRDRIHALRDQEHISMSELRSLRGSVQQAQQISPSQAAYLRRRLALLPDFADDDASPVKQFRTRRCRSYSRPH